jgi:ABC-type branched-subunit amino acid transport system substrate-binding protein
VAQAGGASAVTARGLTATQINIGVVTEQDAANLGKSLGAESLVGGDHVAEIDVLVKELNGHGGIAGRKIVPVYQDVKTSDATSDPSSAAEAACRGLTEDKQVFAVVSIVGAVNNSVMYQCMQKHHTPYFGVDLVPHHAKTFSTYAPYVYGAHTVALERVIPALTARLQADSYFAGWDNSNGAPAKAAAKVGILYVDVDTSYLQEMQQALKSVGHPAVKWFGYRDTLQSLSSDMQSAVLQFRSAGVTHIFIEESDGVLFFAPEAENQGYRPRYGLTTFNAAKALSDTGAVPARQFVGSVGVGWAPLIDVGNQKQDISSAAAQCRKVMKDGGQNTSDATAFFYMAVECDAFQLLKQGLERQTAFTPPGLRQGLEALGNGFGAAAVPALAWRRGFYDGVTAIRDFSYTNGAFAYVGSTHRI